MTKTLSEHNYHGIDATIIADSKNPQGDRITTLVVTLPRIVLAEFNTHRMFSRNSASSRAIPFNKMVKMVEEHPFIPIAWQKDHKGMQGTEYFGEEEVPYSGYHATEKGPASKLLKMLWKGASYAAINAAKLLNKFGVTKQLCNRLLEPFMYHTIIVTATEWENFFKLRCPEYYGKFRSWKDASNLGGATFETPFYMRDNSSQAEIHIQAAAEAMWDAMNESTPKELKAGEWHIPFGDQFDPERLIEAGLSSLKLDDDHNETSVVYHMLRVMIATARCARISYLNFDGKDDYEADIKLHDILKENGHASPFEHCAKVIGDPIYKHLNRSRNFRGFTQYRELINQ